MYFISCHFGQKNPNQRENGFDWVLGPPCYDPHVTTVFVGLHWALNGGGWFCHIMVHLTWLGVCNTQPKPAHSAKKYVTLLRAREEKVEEASPPVEVKQVEQEQRWSRGSRYLETNQRCQVLSAVLLHLKPAKYGRDFAQLVAFHGLLSPALWSQCEPWIEPTRRSETMR